MFSAPLAFVTLWGLSTMSMLAEPRRKVKWSVDPRNSSWSNDDSKFGQKMLERMGWSKGKGLGRSEQGSTEHVKVKVKNNSCGLGANASHEDNWIAHQDEFNELLEQLNSCHSQNGNETPPEEQKGFSLEEKSKTSKKRVHYMKFTKGKDLSCRSETDLNCIFGKRAKSVKEQENNSNSSQGEEEERLPSVSSELDTESITKTVKSTLTMQEYFAQRMARLKMARDSASSLGPSQEGSPDHDTGVSSEEPKKKKKKRSRKSVSELEGGEETYVAPIPSQEDQEQARSGKKKKKRQIVETCSPDFDVERPPSKKKKSKKYKTELLNGHEQTENLTLEPEFVHRMEGKKKSKKDKKKKHQEESRSD